MCRSSFDLKSTSLSVVVLETETKNSVIYNGRKRGTRTRAVVVLCDVCEDERRSRRMNVQVRDDESLSLSFVFSLLLLLLPPSAKNDLSIPVDDGRFKVKN